MDSLASRYLLFAIPISVIGVAVPRRLRDDQLWTKCNRPQPPFTPQPSLAAMTWNEILGSETILAIRYDQRRELLDICFTNDRVGVRRPVTLFGPPALHRRALRETL